MSFNPYSFQKCISSHCRGEFDLSQQLTACPRCGSLIDIDYRWEKLPIPKNLEYFESPPENPNSPQRQSGVWRFHELLPFAALDSCLTIGEGQTILQSADALAPQVGLRAGNLFLQYEGLNPSGSFKDNGMATALTHAQIVGARVIACASTGNTSAAMAMFASATGLFCPIIFIGSGKIAYGKLSQALDYGALTLQIEGDFDDALARVREVCPKLGIYLVNSINPFRLEGQKTIMLRVLRALSWHPPDWIVVPGGNLGNSSAFGKMFGELKQLGLIDRIPRIAIINAIGASTLDQLVNDRGLRWKDGHFDADTSEAYFEQLQSSGAAADTVASAIEINLPVNLAKCLRAIELTDGIVRSVTDTDILLGKALVGRYGMGCEPASGASVAGVKLLREQSIIGPGDRVVCILTGHVLKDPTVTVGYHTDPQWRAAKSIGRAELANAPIVVENDLDRILTVIRQHTSIQ